MYYKIIVFLFKAYFIFKYGIITLYYFVYFIKKNYLIKVQ